jgi:hypothetical protein
MASSSSNSFNSSTASESRREMTPEFNSGAAHEACAPLHWDAEEWDFRAWSKDDESLIDGEDLQFLLGEELEHGDDDEDESWDGYDSSSEEEEDDESTEEDPTAGSFLRARSSDEDNDGDDGGDFDDGANSDDGSSSDDGAMMAATGVAATAMSAQVLRSSIIGSLAPTGGSVDVPSQ